jgi:metal-dependent amidase/aminoacylase/carboxypeptidase family protein
LVPLDPEIFPPFLKTDVVALLRGHLRDSLWGSVGFVFQPGEEIVAGDLHSPYYDFNDDAPAQGIHFLTAMTLDLLAPGP